MYWKWIKDDFEKEFHYFMKCDEEVLKLKKEVLKNGKKILQNLDKKFWKRFSRSSKSGKIIFFKLDTTGSLTEDKNILKMD